MTPVTVQVDATRLFDVIGRVKLAIDVVKPVEVPKCFEGVLLIKSQGTIDGVLVLDAEPTEWTQELFRQYGELTQ